MQVRSKWYLFFVLPSIGYSLAFLIFPIFYSLYLSLHEYRFQQGFIMKFVGLNNIWNLFFEDARAIEAWVNTFYFCTFSVISATLLALVLALLLNEEFRGRSVARAILLIPWAIAPVANAMMWRANFLSWGSVNSILISLGLIPRGVSWLGDAYYLKHIMILAQIYWLIPFSTLLVLASLQTVSNELMEIAKIDGAGILNRFRYVTIPAIKSSLTFVIFLNLLNSMKAFGLVYVMGVRTETRLIYYYAYETVFEKMNVGYGAAIAWIVAFGILFFVVILYRFVPQRR